MPIAEIRVRFEWGPRQESLDQCARRTLGFMKGLRRVHPADRSWTIMGTDHRVPMRMDRVTEVVSKGVNRDYFRQPIEELGFSVWLERVANPNLTLDFSVHCGGFSEHVANALVFGIATTDERGFFTFERTIELVEQIVKAWEPSVGVVTRRELDDRLGDDLMHVVGRFTYRSEASRGELPKGVDARELKPGGWLYFIEPDLFRNVTLREENALRSLAAQITRRGCG